MSALRGIVSARKSNYLNLQVKVHRDCFGIKRLKQEFSVLGNATSIHYSTNSGVSGVVLHHVTRWRVWPLRRHAPCAKDACSSGCWALHADEKLLLNPLLAEMFRMLALSTKLTTAVNEIVRMTNTHFANKEWQCSRYY